MWGDSSSALCTKPLSVCLPVRLCTVLVTEAFSTFQSTLTSGPLQLSMHCHLGGDTDVTCDQDQPAVANHTQSPTQCRWKATMTPVSLWPYVFINTYLRLARCFLEMRYPPPLWCSLASQQGWGPVCSVGCALLHCLFWLQGTVLRTWWSRRKSSLGLSSTQSLPLPSPSQASEDLLTPPAACLAGCAAPVCWAETFSGQADSQQTCTPASMAINCNVFRLDMFFGSPLQMSA